MDFKYVVYVHNGVLSKNSAFKKECNLITCGNIDGTGHHYIKWNKSVTERQVPLVTYTWNIIKA
jgi:hypothetical protein